MGTPSRVAKQRAHARRRAWERFEIQYTRRDEHNIVQQILRNEGTFAWRTSHRVSVWRVKLGDAEVLAAYDRIRKTICTVMPVEFGVNHPAPVAMQEEAAPQDGEIRATDFDGFAWPDCLGLVKRMGGKQWQEEV